MEEVPDVDVSSKQHKLYDREEIGECAAAFWLVGMVYRIQTQSKL